MSLSTNFKFLPTTFTKSFGEGHQLQNWRAKANTQITPSESFERTRILLTRATSFKTKLSATCAESGRRTSCECEHQHTLSMFGRTPTTNCLELEISRHLRWGEVALELSLLRLIQKEESSFEIISQHETINQIPPIQSLTSIHIHKRLVSLVATSWCGPTTITRLS